MKGKFTCWLLMVMLLCTLFPNQALGAYPINNDPLNTTASIPLEEAIQKVKTVFTIPSNLNEFSSAFDSSSDRKIWRLEWSNQNNDEGSFMAEVDAVSGEIRTMHRWTKAENAFSKTPTLSVAEACQIGQKLLTRLLPEKYANLLLQVDSSLIPLGNYESPKYTMNWQRTYKNINVVMDGVSMTIDMQNGEVTDYNLNWSNKNLPDPDGAISSAKAAQVFVSQEILKLQYILDKPWFNSRSNSSKSKPQLIYGIRHSSNGVIDALSGQPLIVDGYGAIYDKMGQIKNTSNLSFAGTPPVMLSPEEQKEIDNSSQFLNQKQAVQAVIKWITIPGSMELDSAALEKNWQNPSLRNWNLSWRSKPSGSGQDAYLWAQIDASNGDLLSFNMNTPTDNNKPKTIQQAEAQKLAEVFIKKIVPQRWSEIILDDQFAQAKPLEINQPSWSFNYLRLVNGILCPDNGINVTVDANTNQVSSYSLNWTRSDFPAASRIMSKAQANDVFLKAAPLKLSYMNVPDANGSSLIKLVYIPEIKNGFFMLDATSGKGLDVNGNPLVDIPQAYIFQDIKGHFGEKEIATLGQAGVFGEYVNQFHPNENIKLIALLRAMISAKEGIYSTGGVDEAEIMQRCQRLGWIKENSSPQAEVNREILAQLMVRFLNIDYLSQAQGIYQVPYQDAAGMSAPTKAYASLCWGLGIIKADGKTFNAEHTISRAEAAVALVHTLSIKTQQ